MKNDFILEDFLPFRLNRLAAEVSERLAAIYAEQFNLDIPKWRVLATLSNQGETTAQDIVISTRTHKSTISRAVHQLEARGLVERTVSGTDRRANALGLTAAGKRLFSQLQPTVLAYEDALLMQLSAPDAKALARGLAALEATLNLGKGNKS